MKVKIFRIFLAKKYLKQSRSILL